MTQAEVNNAKVLYQLSVERAVVEKTDALIFLTPELLEVLENPTIDEKKKQEIIERVCALEEIPQIMVNFLKMMSHLGNCDMMRQIFDAYYQYWDEQNHIMRAQIIFDLFLNNGDNICCTYCTHRVHLPVNFLSN